MLKKTALYKTTLVFFLISAAFAQSTTEWKVKPEWVRAHEAFLAGDAMRGRGSATPDEWIAATYVASQFENYGLKPGMPDGTYIQRVELAQPVIEGTATIDAPGFAPLQEGKDFNLVRSDGQSLSGRLLKMSSSEAGTPQFQSGTILLFSNDFGGQTRSFMRQAALAGVKALLRIGPALAMNSGQAFSRKAAVRPHLRGSRSAMGSLAILELAPAAAARIAKLNDGTNLEVKIPAKQTPRYSYNAVGLLPGTDTSAGAKVILLSAHLDHLGISQPVDGDAIYNGANDDASGTTAVMEIAHALASGPHLRRTVYFVCYGSEEFGGLGSTYFREHPPLPLERIAANLEFEMIGNQDPRMAQGKLLLTGWDRSNLGSTLVEHGALLGDDPYPEEHFFERSDNYPLALKGIVAQTAAGWGSPPTYHQPDDDLSHLDFDFMVHAIQSLIEPVRWLANSDFVPQWLPGKQPQSGR